MKAVAGEGEHDQTLIKLYAEFGGKMGRVNWKAVGVKYPDLQKTLTYSRRGAKPWQKGQQRMSLLRQAGLLKGVPSLNEISPEQLAAAEAADDLILKLLQHVRFCPGCGKHLMPLYQGALAEIKLTA